MSDTRALTALKMLTAGRSVPFTAAAVGLTAEAVLDLAGEHGATRADGSLDPAAAGHAVAELERAARPRIATRDPAVVPARPASRAEHPPGTGRRALGGLMSIGVRLIDTDGRNVREDLGDLTELAASIRSVGVLQPITVAAKGERFTLIYGHRRLGAALLAGLTEVPAMLRVGRDEVGTRVERLAENLHRKALAPMEEATQYRILIRAGMSQSEIARRVGVSAATVSSRLSLLELPADAQQMVRDRRLPLAEATQLARQVRATGSGAVTHSTPAAVDYWATHPLLEEARQRCAHYARRHYGGTVRTGACGPCLEAVIRADEGLRLLTSPRPSRKDNP
jgi:ParB/RepB/Spo0J family partition protein